MKKSLIISLLLLITGCSGTCGEFFKHETVWKNWDHARFSYQKEVTEKDVIQSEVECWWGCPVEVSE